MKLRRLDDGIEARTGTWSGAFDCRDASRDFCDIHVKHQSEVGKGSMLSGESPDIARGFSRCQGLSPTLPSLSAPLAGMTILAVDDAATAILDAMERLLKGWGCDVRVAADLNEARHLVQNFAGGPDVIIADYHLDHDATGIDLIAALRHDFGREIASVLVTAGSESERTRRRADGGHRSLT